MSIKQERAGERNIGFLVAFGKELGKADETRKFKFDFPFYVPLGIIGELAVQNDFEGYKIYLYL